MIALFVVGCMGQAADVVIEVHEAEPIGEAECAVCGMMVAEQPAPRGQVAHRDGTHSFVCSIEELRAVAQQRSAKGRPAAVFVEGLARDFDVTSSSTASHPWLDVDTTWFVFGAERAGVMGAPVLSFADEVAANAQAKRLGTTPLRWTALLETPFHEIPPGSAVKSSP